MCVCLCCSYTAGEKCAQAPLQENSTKNKLLESPEVEKEVERLIREDLAAINVVILLYLTPVCMYVYWAEVIFICIVHC